MPPAEIFVTGYGYDEFTGKDFVTLCLENSTTSPVAELPGALARMRAWPNPFNPRVNFDFYLPQTADVQLAIFDLRGRQVAEVLAGAWNRAIIGPTGTVGGPDGRAAAPGFTWRSSPGGSETNFPQNRPDEIDGFPGRDMETGMRGPRGPAFLSRLAQGVGQAGNIPPVFLEMIHQ